ncbi:MAG: hypothetical protein QM690_22175, partial [Sphingobium sp.]
ELPEPITVAGHYETRTIAFSSSAILAVLDLPDPDPLAKEQGIKNALDADPLIDALSASSQPSRAQIETEISFRKFMGEKVVKDETEPAEQEGGFGAHTTITRTISNVQSHPGKTLYGCSYRMELLDRNGNPL